MNGSPASFPAIDVQQLLGARVLERLLLAPLEDRQPGLLEVAVEDLLRRRGREDRLELPAPAAPGRVEDDEDVLLPGSPAFAAAARTDVRGRGRGHGDRPARRSPPRTTLATRRRLDMRRESTRAHARGRFRGSRDPLPAAPYSPDRRRRTRSASAAVDGLQPEPKPAPRSFRRSLTSMPASAARSFFASAATAFASSSAASRRKARAASSESAYSVVQSSLQVAPEGFAEGRVVAGVDRCGRFLRVRGHREASGYDVRT